MPRLAIHVVTRLCSYMKKFIAVLFHVMIDRFSEIFKADWRITMFAMIPDVGADINNVLNILVIILCRHLTQLSPFNAAFLPCRAS